MVQVNLSTPQFVKDHKPAAIATGGAVAVGAGAAIADKMVKSAKVAKVVDKLTTNKAANAVKTAATITKSGFTTAAKYLASKPGIKQVVGYVGQMNGKVKIAAGIAAAAVVALAYKANKSEQ